MIPSVFSYSVGIGIRPANGSSVTGSCLDVRFGVTEVICFRPTSSILFDGNVPTLTGLGGDMWASQLLAIEAPGNSVEFTFNFADTPGYTGVRGVEVVMFNCPEWGISVESLTLRATSETRNILTTISVTTTSCDSLARVQLPRTISSSLQVITLQFNLPSTSTWVHLAEVTFLTDVLTSPPDTIITIQGTTNTFESKNSIRMSVQPAMCCRLQVLKRESPLLLYNHFLIHYYDHYI